MNNIKQALTDMLRIVLVVALPVILILALLLLYRFLWPSASIISDNPSSKQSKMIYPDSADDNVNEINTHTWV